MPVKASRSRDNAHFVLMMGLIVLLFSKVGCQITEETSNGSDLELDNLATDIPPHIAQQLDCSRVNATICTQLASEYGHTYEHEDVCYPLSDQDEPTGQFAPCNLICSDYQEMDDKEKDYCDKRCPYYIETCETEDVTTPQTQFPSQPWTDNRTCGATEEMCESTLVPHNENFNMSCYQVNTNPNRPEYKPCQPICASDSVRDIDACEYYCPEYTKRCKTKEVTTDPRMVAPQTKFPPPPWTDNPTCGATEAMCKSTRVPHNENFNMSCYQDNTNPKEPEYKSCQPICASDFEKDSDACQYYCPGYLEACGRTTSSTTESPAEPAAKTGLPPMYEIVIPVTVIAIGLLIAVAAVIVIRCLRNRRRRRKLHYEKTNQDCETSSAIGGDSETEETSFSTDHT